MIVYDADSIPQGSEAWALARAGIPTASEFDHVEVIIGKGGKQTASNAEKIEQYAAKKVAEIFLKRPIQDTPMTKAMEIGTIEEESAVMLYEMTCGLKTKKVGFITDDNGYYGCSPDRLVGDDGLLECKRPLEKTHMLYLTDPNRLVEKYWHQSQGQLFVCQDREWVDMYSYNPEMPPVVQRVFRDPEYQEKLASDLENFRSVMNGMIEKLIEQGHMRV